MADLLDGSDDVGVGSAAADVAVHGVLDVVVGGADVFFENGHGGHDLAGGAVAALVAVVLDEGGLHGVEVAGLADAFDGGDLVGGGRVHEGEGHAGVDASAVDVDGAGSALAVVAALLGAGQVEVLAQAVEQGGARIHIEGVGLAVDSKGEGLGAGLWSLLRVSAGSSGRSCCEDRRSRGDEAGGPDVGEEGAAGYARGERVWGGFAVEWRFGHGAS